MSKRTILIEIDDIGSVTITRSIGVSKLDLLGASKMLEHCATSELAVRHHTVAESKDYKSQPDTSNHQMD